MTTVLLILNNWENNILENLFSKPINGDLVTPAPRYLLFSCCSLHEPLQDAVHLVNHYKMLFIRWTITRCCSFGEPLQDAVHLVNHYKMLFIWWTITGCCSFGEPLQDVVHLVNHYKMLFILEILKNQFSGRHSTDSLPTWMCANCLCLDNQ